MRTVEMCDERRAAFGGQAMVRRAIVSSGESQVLVNRLRWHVQQALHHDGVSAALTLHLLAPATGEGRCAVTFDPVVERIRTLIRAGDVIEVDAADGIGIVLHGAEIEGARAVFMRLRDALCSPIPPRGPDEVAVPVALGYAASSSFAGCTPGAEAMRSAAHVDADGAMVSSLEAMSAAVLDAAWTPRTVLTLTLPMRGTRPTPPDAHTRYGRRMEDEQEQTNGGMQAQESDRPVLEQSAPMGNACGAAEGEAHRRTAQRGHLRLVASQQVTLPEIEAMRSLARAMGVPFVRIPAHLSRSCRSILHPTIACELRAVPIGRTRGVLTIAMHDPTDTEALQRLQTLIGLSIFPVLAAPDEIDRALRQLMST